MTSLDIKNLKALKLGVLRMNEVVFREIGLKQRAESTEVVSVNTLIRHAPE